MAIDLESTYRLFVACAGTCGADSTITFELAVIFPVTVKLFKVPTDVRVDVTTEVLRLVPVNVPAAAVIVIFAEPSKATPFIVLALDKITA